MLSCLQFDLATITNSLADMEGDEEVPKIKLGDASCAAPFTSKLSNVSASESAEYISPVHDPEYFDQSRTSFAKDGVHLSRPFRCTRF